MLTATFKTFGGRKYEIPVQSIEQADRVIANAYKRFGEITNVNIKVNKDEKPKPSGS